MTSHPRQLPVAVIGAGPVGLSAAARLARRGEPAIVLEAGSAPGASIREWGHVRLFSPWDECLDPVAKAMLEEGGWTAPPPDRLPTGDELVSAYLEPLAELPALHGDVRYGHRVTAVTRVDRDRLGGRSDRSEAPFLLRIESGGIRDELRARAVIDASGTWRQPRPLGAHGLPALGEEEASRHVRYGPPDLLGGDRDRYAGRSTAVVGGGHSAAHVLLDLVELREEAPATEPVWVLRGGRPDSIFGPGSGEDDELAARAALERRLRETVEAGAVRVITGFGTRAVRDLGEGAALVDGSGRTLEADRIVAVTGFEPDLEMLDELRLDLDPRTGAPRALGPLIDPDVHTCGSVPPHGEDELRHPEPGLYVVGMKSYGRAPTFLLPTGYGQVRSVVAKLTGDRRAGEAGEHERTEGEVEAPAAAACCTSAPRSAAADSEARRA